MPVDGADPVGPVGVFESGARASANIFLARGSSFPLAVLEEGNEVARFVCSYLMGKRMERPIPSQGNAGSTLVNGLGVLLLTFPHLKPTAASRSGKSGDEPARVLSIRATRRRPSLLAARRMPGRSVRGAGYCVMVQGGSVRGACPPCRV